MYRRIVLFVILTSALVLFACSKPNDDEKVLENGPEEVSTGIQVSKAPEVIEDMPIPKVVLGLWRNSYDVCEKTFAAPFENIKVGGPVKYVKVVFGRNILMASTANTIKVEGCSYTVDIDHNTISIETNELAGGAVMKLSISGDLKDVSGRRLKGGLKLDIATLEKGAEVKYKLKGLENDLPLEEYLDERIKLTREPKTFVLEFSKDMDKKSVEDSISKLQPVQGVTYSFKWIDDRKLELGMDGLKTEDQYGGVSHYTINVLDAVDCDGRQAGNNLDFSAYDQNSLGYIDMGTKKSKILKEFHDVLYATSPNYLMDRYVLLHNPAEEKSYDFQDGRMAANFVNKGACFFDWNNTAWLDERTLLYYGWDQNNEAFIRTYSIDGTMGKEIKCPNMDVNEWLKMISLSPDRSKIAILGDNLISQDNPGSLYIISLEGKLLYKYTGIVNLRGMKAYNMEQEIAWLDNSHIAIEDTAYKDGKMSCSIVNLDIRSGAKKLLIKDAKVPVTVPGSNIILAEKYDGSGQPSDFMIVSGGSEIGTIKRNPVNLEGYLSCRNFMFLDKNRILFNRNDDIVLYDISLSSEEVLGSGEIIGSSKAKDKIYYMTNYQSLYTYY